MILDNTCIQPVNGVCIITDLDNYVVGTCCSGSQCVKGTDSSDWFCQSFTLAEGDNCDPAVRRNY